MADSDLVALGAFTPILTDLLYGVDDPGVTPIDGKHTYAVLRDLLEANLVAPVIAAGGNASALVVTGYSLTSADATSMIDLAGTWNTSGAPAAILLNITNTASGGLAKLMDLKVGGVSQFAVTKEGRMESKEIGGDGGTNIKFDNSFSGKITMKLGNASPQFYAESAHPLTIGSKGLEGLLIAVALGSTPLLVGVTVDDNDILAQRNGTTAQISRIYATWGSATDYHRAAFETAKATLTNVSGASVTASSLIPDGAVVIGVTTKVTTGLGTGNGTTGYNVGDGSDADRWGSITGTASGTSSDNRDWTATTVQAFTSANDVVLTALGGNFDGTGVIDVSVQYLIGQVD